MASAKYRVYVRLKNGDQVGGRVLYEGPPPASGTELEVPPSPRGHAVMRSITKPHLPSDFVRVDDLADDRPREAASLIGLGMGRANPRFDCTAP